jgi:predicted transcriptional regulator
MKFTTISNVSAAFLLVAGTTLYAQSTTASVATTTTPSTVTGKSIAERKTNQQDRIGEGLKSGEMTSSEAASVEKQEAGVNKEESGMRAQDNGKLTTQDKTTLNAQLNTESKDIYADKHNGSTQPKAGTGEVNKRLDNQQARIGTGVDDKTLTATQTAKLETQEAGVHKEESGMRAQDNGKLSAQDKKTLNHQLNEESRRINRDERRTARKS